MAQYFYPQRQTKVMNEGCATWTHYKIMNKLHETGQIDDGAYLEFLTSHTNVVMQPGFDERHYGGFNPYALGFAMMSDLERMAYNPTDEDRAWFPDVAGCGDGVGALRQIWADYRDESFISQYLSPRLMRQFRMFRLLDDPAHPSILVDAIHNEQGYRRVRRALARDYDMGRSDPNIEVVAVDFAGDRKLVLHHNVLEGRQLAPDDASKVMQHLANLWGYDVVMSEVDTDGNKLKTYEASADIGWAG